ncbi:hypothetical protein F2Q70_00006599 [Brassica cretica]|uniref:Uncharacterized protein n=1 Tax=Brassica cretica TaxID=69181 RepID=A0A8S9ISL6_BRACR|nr:hypothetical protein F2Q70_00006599 [Brassica cretica]
MESGIQAPPPLSLLQNINSVVSGSLSALMDSNNGSSVVANSLSLSTSSSPLSRSLSMPSTLSSSALLTVGTSQDRTIDLPLGSGSVLVQACDPPTQLMVPASFRVQETSTTSEYNVTLGSQDDCSAPFVISSVINGSESAQSQQHETITSDPLLFKPPVTPPEPSTPRNYDPTLIGNQLAALWPSLTDEILNKKPKSKHPTRTLQPPIEKLPPPKLKPDGSLRFLWAARLSPQSRNLYRATTPTYRMDTLASPSSTMHPKDPKATENLLIPTPESGHVLEEVRLVAVLETLSPSSHSKQEKPIVPLNSVPAYSTLVDAQSTPTDSQIMETSPSSIINNKVLESSVIDPLTTSTNNCAFESPSRFTVLEEVDEAEIEPSNSFSLTRGGRESKPPIKYQNMEWMTVRERGNRGRQGRGSYH